MKRINFLIAIFLTLIAFACHNNEPSIPVVVYETSAAGNKLMKLNQFAKTDHQVDISVSPDTKFQTILGFGGAFTESSAYLLNKLSKLKREELLKAYFSAEGANYSLTRTHINSCDFSLGNYSYATENDPELNNFSINEDKDDLIPMIKQAMAISENGFKILASPWTAPPWMKDNNNWVGGKLLPQYYDTWALFLSKYLTAYASEGINIWAVTVENEPLGNGNNWESMHFTPQEMVDFTNNHLGPKLKQDGHDVLIFGYDQNRGEELKEWAKVIYADSLSSEYFDGIAVHWYASTNDWMPESLEFTHNSAPLKHLLQTEGCVDAEVPHWNDDNWYWEKEATDWGWDWAPADAKYLHPKYVPVYRYASDIIGCLNSWVEGWIDWNMVLDRQGGPNWFKNWCVAPVIVDTETDEVYYTPLYYTMAHFSKFIRPGAVRIGVTCSDNELMVTALQNPDQSIVLVALNRDNVAKSIHLAVSDLSADFTIDGRAIQTICLPIKTGN